MQKLTITAMIDLETYKNLELLASDLRKPASDFATGDDSKPAIETFIKSTTLFMVILIYI